jgi:inward rectifier potassium channel
MTDRVEEQPGDGIVDGRLPIEETSNGELPQEDLRDLGFGARVTTESQLRLLNRDGSFNVVRHGLPILQTRNVYQKLLTIPWWQFYHLMIAGYLALNLLFTFAYMLTGPEAISGLVGATTGSLFLESFFFSVQTITTVGYGNLHPVTTGANLLVALEAFIGLGGFAVGAALMFARISRPTAKMVFSRNAIIAPHGGASAFMFRIANERRNELLDVEARVLLSRLEDVDGRMTRRFHELKLERQKVAFLPLHWTVVHPIDEDSPLSGVTEADLKASESEVLLLITAIDDTFSETVHARSSYTCEEILWDRKFSDIFRKTGEGRLSIHIRDIHEIDEIAA